MTDTTEITALDNSLIEQSVCTFALGKRFSQQETRVNRISNAQVNPSAGKSSLIHQAVYVCRTCGGEDEHKGCCAGIYH